MTLSLITAQFGLMPLKVALVSSNFPSLVLAGFLILLTADPTILDIAITLLGA
jgi:hypothetical protein